MFAGSSSGESATTSTTPSRPMTPSSRSWLSGTRVAVQVRRCDSRSPNQAVPADCVPSSATLASRFARGTQPLNRRAVDDSDMKLVVWNVEWASPRSARGRAVREELIRSHADLICLTEGTGDLLPGDGALVESEPDYGYGIQPQRRKVLLWARDGFCSSDSTSPAGMPVGRFATGVMRTGGVHVVGVCIPWSQAHVSTGARDRRPWQDHVAYLAALQTYLGALQERPVFVLGDFNQTIPRSRAPRAVHDELVRTLGELQVLTAHRQAVPPLIDHIAASPEIELAAWSCLPSLSDHTGWSAEVRVVQLSRYRAPTAAPFLERPGT